MAQALTELGLEPEQILCSDARRTTETAERMNATREEPWPVTFKSGLYLPEVTTLVSLLASRSSAMNTVMVLSHNPGCEGVVRWLSGASETMTTANIAVLTARAAAWGDLLDEPRQWTLTRVLRPRGR
jgi:phosphohistidine phosphatase